MNKVLFCFSPLTLIFLITSGQESKLPNIVLIYADDLGYGDLGCYGADDIHTPNINNLADKGLKFTDFYSASPSCSPSRAALLTGKYPPQTGINEVFFPESHTGLSSSELTLAELLKGRGYSTGIVGKWHLGHFPQYLPLQHGFDSYFGIPYSNDMKSVVYMRGNQIESFRVDQSLITKRYTIESKAFIMKNSQSPFFLFISHNMPHVPIYASEDFKGSSQRGLYGDVIQELDWSVGEIIATLEEEGLMDNTLIMFTSDNGPWLSMYDLGGSAGILREGKQHTFEGGMRVPMVAMWKGKIKTGTVTKSVASQMDILPTIAHIVGEEQKEFWDGKNLAKLLLAGEPPTDQSFIYFKSRKARAYRNGDWKVKLPFKGYQESDYRRASPAHDTLLFNLKHDMGETQNLFSSNKPKAMELINEMNTQVKLMAPFPKHIITTSKADRSHFDYLKKTKRNAEK